MTSPSDLRRYTGTNHTPQRAAVFANCEACQWPVACRGYKACLQAERVAGIEAWTQERTSSVPRQQRRKTNKPGSQ